MDQGSQQTYFGLWRVRNSYRHAGVVKFVARDRPGRQIELGILDP